MGLQSKQERSQWFSLTSVARMQGVQGTQSPAGTANFRDGKEKPMTQVTCLYTELVNTEMKSTCTQERQTLLQSRCPVCCGSFLLRLMPRLPLGREKHDGDRHAG